MIFLKSLLIIVVLLFAAGYLINTSISAKLPTEKPAQSDHVQNDTFKNTTQFQPHSFSKTLGIWLRFFTEKKVNTMPAIDIPVMPLSKTDLDILSNNEVHVIKLGHSSILLKIMGEYWLIDPVFSDRASPFGFAGPKRFHQPPISLEELPPIDRVLISHNHYDHLDKKTIKVLANKTKAFYVPFGVEEDLKAWGIEDNRITVFDWWDDVQTEHAMISFTPTQHFSGRGLKDGNRTLWGSWAIKTVDTNLYFSGDSGYFDGFKKIGEKYGPFDLTFIETGAYDKDWSKIHMLPEESIQAHIDLQGQTMVPIHNGTFELAFHAWYEPFDRVSAEAERRSVALSTPVFGQIFKPQEAPTKNSWWRSDLSQ